MCTPRLCRATYLQTESDYETLLAGQPGAFPGLCHIQAFSDEVDQSAAAYTTKTFAEVSCEIDMEERSEQVRSLPFQTSSIILGTI
jgi:hypothetical protein